MYVCDYEFVRAYGSVSKLLCAHTAVYTLLHEHTELWLRLCTDSNCLRFLACATAALLEAASTSKVASSTARAQRE
jgi:hypothetical protein